MARLIATGSSRIGEQDADAREACAHRESRGNAACSAAFKLAGALVCFNGTRRAQYRFIGAPVPALCGGRGRLAPCVCAWGRAVTALKTARECKAASMRTSRFELGPAGVRSKRLSAACINTF